MKTGASVAHSRERVPHVLKSSLKVWLNPVAFTALSKIELCLILQFWTTGSFGSLWLKLKICLNWKHKNFHFDPIMTQLEQDWKTKTLNWRLTYFSPSWFPESLFNYSMHHWTCDVKKTRQECSWCKNQCWCHRVTHCSEGRKRTYCA